MGQLSERYREAIEVLWNRRELDRVPEFFHPDYNGHDTVLERRGQAGALNALVFFQERMRNLHYRVLQTVEEGEWIAARWSVDADFYGPLLGLSGQGQRVTVQGMSMNRMVGGQFLEGFIIDDATSLASQLGHTSLAGGSASDLYYLRCGQGRPLMFMHGGLGLDHSYFRPYLDPLSEQAKLIFYDHRGNGRSPRPADGSPLDFNRWCDDAEALRRKLGLGKIVILGHSYGGFIAQSFALRYPDSVAGLILSNTAPALDYPNVIMANAERRAKPGQMPSVLKAFTQPAANDLDMQRTWMDILSLYFHRYDPQVGKAMDAAMVYSAAGFNASMRAAGTFNAVPRLSELTMPVLILGGNDDWITPLAEGSQRLAKHLPHAETFVFQRSGHFPFIEERDQYLQVVRDWLARLPPAE